jgi:hypothetical protein
MRPVDRHVEERPNLLTLPVRPFDASEVVYRTVDAEGFVVYRNNFYATPWRLIGQPVALRTTEDELMIHDRAFVEAARHPLFPRRWLDCAVSATTMSHPATRNTGWSN